MNNEELTKLADRALRAKLIADEAIEQAEDAKSAFEAGLVEMGKLSPDTKAIGDVRVSIVPNRYFDQATAEKLVTKRVLKECEVTAVDAKKLKMHLNPIQLEQAMKSHAKAFKLGLKVLDE